METTPASKPQQLSGLAVFFYVFMPFAFGHYLSLLLRNVNSLLAPDLVGALSLSSGQLGLLTSVFFLTYALVQLPVGVALDRYGARKVQLVLMMTAATGTLLFAKGESFAQLVFARALIGLGLAACFMSAVKVISARISPGKVPSVHGYLIAVGGLGSASATMPVRQVLEYTDWRGLFIALAVLTACAGLLIWLVAPRDQPMRNAKVPTIKSVLGVYKEPAFRQTISLILIPHAIFFGVQGLWIGRWLTDVARFPQEAVAYLLYMSMAAVIFGAIAVGIGTERAARRGIKPLDMAGVGVAVFVAVQCMIVLNYAPSFQLLAVLFTLVGTITGMDYAIVAQTVSREMTGRASTCLNLLIFTGAFLVQAGFGVVVGMWQPDVSGRYPVIAYQAAFATLVLLQLPGLLGWARQRLASARPKTMGAEVAKEAQSAA